MGWCHVLLGFQHVVSSLHLVLESTAHALWFVDHAQDKQSAQPSRKEKTSPCGILKETLKKAKHHHENKSSIRKMIMLLICYTNA